MKSIYFFLSALFLLFNSCTKEIPTAKPVAIVPIPNTIELQDQVFVLDKNTIMVIPEAWQAVGNFLQHYIEKGIQTPLLQRATATNNYIRFEIDSTIEETEAYRLQVTPQGVLITAKEAQGAFYGIQSLLQLFPVSFENQTYPNNRVAIRCLTIKDAPKYAYRGLHLDVGRHFFSVNFIKKYIDLLARLKLNKFHWHLTEDQGWRIEIKKYPKLTTIGAFRKETLLGHAREKPHQFDGKPYGGFYTQEEVKEIVAYAKQRFVTVIPEIELPGHSSAAIAAYPELGCGLREVEVATKWGIFDDIYCTKESTFSFLEDVLDEVMELFPSTYIHIGGDEAPKANWNACSNCKQKIKDLGLKDSHQLQSYFITRIERYLNSKGRQIIGWDEILEGGLAPNATVMSWRGLKGGIAAAKQKHAVILSPTSHCYFDYYQSESEKEPLAFGNYLPLEKVYSFNPELPELNTEEQKYIVGIQANLWTEYMPTSRQVEYMAYPRALAISEIAWSGPQRRTFPEFAKAALHYSKRLNALDVNYAKHFYALQPQIKNKAGKIVLSFSENLQSQNLQYHFGGKTFDSNKSKAYTKPLEIVDSTTFHAAIVDQEGKIVGYPISKTIRPHIGTKASLNCYPSPHKNYISGGITAIQNGVFGNHKRYNDNEWLGFRTKENEDIWIDYQWETTQQIQQLQTRVHNANNHWIYSPKCIELYTNKEQPPFYIYNVQAGTNTHIPIQLQFPTITTRSLFIKIMPFGTIPTGKAGTGSIGWTFLDEFILQ